MSQTQQIFCIGDIIKYNGSKGNVRGIIIGKLKDPWKWMYVIKVTSGEGFHSEARTLPINHFEYIDQRILAIMRQHNTYLPKDIFYAREDELSLLPTSIKYIENL